MIKLITSAACYEPIFSGRQIKAENPQSPTTRVANQKATKPQSGKWQVVRDLQRKARLYGHMEMPKKIYF